MTMMHWGRRAFVLALMLGTLTGSYASARAAEDAHEGHSAGDLAKATQNPVGDLTSIPFQFNFNTGGPYLDRTFYNLNIQPVMPLKVSDDWTLIARTIVPYLNIPLPGGTPGLEPRATGIGDIQEQLFFTPAKPGGLIWGVGAVASFPTATNDAARTGDWGLGPNLVLLEMAGPWVLGTLANQIWTVGGDDIGENIDQLLIQPFVNYNLANGWALSSAPILTRNGAITSGEKWTVPVGGGISKVAAIGKRPVSIGLQYFHNAVRPESVAEEQLRMTFSLLYPVAK